MGTERSLRTALSGNAAFSGVCAALLLFAPDAVGAWLGVDGGALFPILGTGLLAFAAGLTLVATRPTLPLGWVRTAIVADALWIVATIGFFLTPWSAALSRQGVWIVILVAMCVLGWGIFQAAGLRAAPTHGAAMTS